MTDLPSLYNIFNLRKNDFFSVDFYLKNIRFLRPENTLYDTTLEYYYLLIINS